jgi:hypothetical protein
MHYLSVLAIFKNEGMNLKLWVDHYLWQGVDHFYLIDNDSSDNPLGVLQDYIDRGIVTYYFLPQPYMQTAHYTYVFNKANLKKETFWLVVCDLDEIFFGTDKKLSTTLKTMEGEVDYLLCNWKMFGSDGHVTQPPDIRTDIVHRWEGLHPNTKYIFKPQIVRDGSNVWIHGLMDLHVEKTRTENASIQLNHYPIQSLEFFQKVKMTRGDVANSAVNTIRTMGYFNAYDHRGFRDEILKNLILNPPADYST